MSADAVDRNRSEPAPGEERADLVRAAANGDARAWEELVRTYSSLIAAIARRFRLDPASVQDVEQIVWMRCFAHLRTLREPAALPGWLRTMAHREALRMAAGQSRSTTMDPDDLERILADRETTADPSVEALRSEAARAVQDGLSELTPDQRRLLIVLHADTGIPYQEFSRTLGMPTGSIGPTKSRCLTKLRRTAALQRYLSPPAESA